MSNHTAQSSSFGAIEANTALAGNHFSGQTTIAIHGPQDQPQPRPPAVCRSIPFPRNNGLVHRSAFASRLDQLLPGTPGYRAAALWGLGGSGKTQIALEYAYSRQRDPHCSVFWVHADSETSFTQDYHSIARKLGLGGDLSGKALLQAVCDWIEANPNWVLVLDNADDLTWFGVAQQQRRPDSSEPRLNLNAFIPKCLTGTGTGTVLWTSRDQQIDSLVGVQQAVRIVRMTSEEAETLLDTVRNREKSKDEYDAAEKLLAELDHLPLAISQAAAYMRRTSISIRDYLSDIQRRKKRRKLLGRAEYDRFRREQGSNSILETWDISVEHLRKENELIYDVLHCLAFVDNQNIPFELIHEASRLPNQSSSIDEETDSDEENNDDEEMDGDDEGSNSGQEIYYGDEESESSEESASDYNVREVIARLCEFSFLSVRPSSPEGCAEAYDMHNLVQEAARYRLQKGKDEAKGEAYFAKTAFQITNHLFPYPHREAWERCEQYLTHAQQAATWAELHKGEVGVARLLMRLGGYLWGRCRWREMAAVSKKALDFRQKTLGDEHPDTVNAMYNLGIAYFGQGMHKEAEKLYRQVVLLREEALGSKHPHTLDTMTALANSISEQGNYKITEAMYRQTLALCMEVLGSRHPNTLENMNNLAKAIGNQGRYEEAEIIFWQTLALQIEVLGRRHPFTLYSINSLAICIGYQGKHGEAENIFRQTLALQIEVLGRRHPGTLNSMYSLAICIGHQGKHGEAENIFRQTLALQIEVLGRRHPYTLHSMGSLAISLRKQGKYGEAENIFQQTLVLQIVVLGRRHPGTRRSMQNLCWVLRCQGKENEAEEIVRDFRADNGCTPQGDDETNTTHPPGTHP
ncbi:kinesin light chain [Ustulina deusta]|nr:kinesin light chain [Ustulina deusta]